MRFAAGVSLVQIGWVARLARPEGWDMLAYAALVVAELSVPIWAELHGWGKDERRAIFQGYNLSILLVSLAAHLIAGTFTASVVPLLLLAVPSAMAGAWLGRKLYDRVDARRFSRIVLWLVWCAGVSLLGFGLLRG